MDAFVVVSHSAGVLSVEQSGAFQTLNYYKSKATRSPICIPFCHIKDTSLKAFRYSKMCFSSKGSLKKNFVSMVNTPLVVCHFLLILWSKKTTPMSLSLSAATVRGCHKWVKWAFVDTQPVYYLPVLGAQELQEIFQLQNRSLVLGKVCCLSQHRLCSCEQGPSKAFLMLGRFLRQWGSANSSHKASLRCSDRTNPTAV